jgi:hypothetical protein
MPNVFLTQQCSGFSIRCVYDRAAARRLTYRFACVAGAGVEGAEFEVSSNSGLPGAASSFCDALCDVFGDWARATPRAASPVHHRQNRACFPGYGQALRRISAEFQNPGTVASGLWRAVMGRKDAAICARAEPAATAFALA